MLSIEPLTGGMGLPVSYQHCFFEYMQACKVLDFMANTTLGSNNAADIQKRE